jgi:hypothetical protein
VREQLRQIEKRLETLEQHYANLKGVTKEIDEIRASPEIGAIPMVVTGTHEPYLVALSILVACFASYTALDLS